MKAITVALILSTHTISAHMPFAECLALIDGYKAKMGGMVSKESTPTSRVVFFPIQNLTVVCSQDGIKVTGPLSVDPLAVMQPPLFDAISPLDFRR